MSDITCSIDGCKSKHKGHGWCNKHLRRWRLYGSPTGKPTTRASYTDTAIERVVRIGWTEVVRRPELGPCWEWNGARGQAGHGQIRMHGSTRQVHRVTLEHHSGPIPEGENSLHRCDNPPCLNPDHLFAGTQKENMHDMWRKGRQQLYVDQPLGSRHPGAKLTEAQVLELRAMRQGGATYQSLVVRFGISKTNVADIVKRKIWRHI